MCFAVVLPDFSITEAFDANCVRTACKSALDFPPMPTYLTENNNMHSFYLGFRI